MVVSQNKGLGLYIGIMENKMETGILYRVYVVVSQNNNRVILG